jgi:hypothetical protein
MSETKSVQPASYQDEQQVQLAANLELAASSSGQEKARWGWLFKSFGDHVRETRSRMWTEAENVAGLLRGLLLNGKDFETAAQYADRYESWVEMRLDKVRRSSFRRLTWPGSPNESLVKTSGLPADRKHSYRQATKRVFEHLQDSASWLCNCDRCRDDYLIIFQFETEAKFRDARRAKMKRKAKQH